jgi:hypothetical protein
MQGPGILLGMEAGSLGEGFSPPRTGPREVRVSSGGIYGRADGGNFEGGSTLVVAFTVSGLVQIIRKLLIHCGGPSCNSVSLGMYIVQPHLSGGL